ncbi:sulfotransferase domain-containing protein [Paracoccus sp. DMF-8]|uniref:sulfotransferase family protein n=1 Tax=Paracoccus sp. DMF-8 TaxID=3019445 RepID=UPI0023E43E9A|nr:sulfotransferase domain-containing protein [Paracoccus sp. DMF-8]MDF3607355.1 sulfotransferase domain-containing protein [Paracoccus sp. DMF-8]
MSSAEANFLFCVGAQKAGTTWLYSYFAAHPQVHVQPVKEIHYFNVLWDPKQIGFREMREEHLASFAKEPALAEAGDIAPTDSVRGGERYLQMQSAFPDSKFLYLMRDPIQRMWSQIRMRRQWMRSNVNPDATEDSLTPPKSIPTC